jgi:YD repeat-containing protein
LRSTDPSGASSTLRYDENNLPVQVTDALG